MEITVNWLFLDLQHKWQKMLVLFPGITQCAEYSG